MSDELRILLAQHAKTSELLGVDFLPLGTIPECLKSSQSVKQASEPPSFQVRPPADDASPPPALGAGEPEIKPIASQDLYETYAHLDAPQDQLDALSQKYELDAPHKEFNTRFTNIVFGEGSPVAELMFVGEAPGEQEDLTGRPFVGRAGQLLDKMIGAMGLDRQSVYITNVLKTRPPNNATPTTRESILCAPYLLEQIRIIKPKVIVTLGLPATHLLSGSTSPMRALRGHWRVFDPSAVGSGAFSGACSGQEPGSMGKIELMATYHPAYLLRSYTQENRRKVWSDLSMVMEKLGLERAK